MRKWISLFSRSGSEIGNIWKRTGKFPSVIYTNNTGNYADVFNEMLRKEDIELKVFDDFTVLFDELRKEDSDSVVTLHGFLRIIPDDICSKFAIFNGHPGNILKYNHLKGINPQIRAFNLGHTDIGGVIHKVIPEVDAGEVILSKSKEFNPSDLQTADDYFEHLADIMLSLWVNVIEENKLR